MTASRSVPTSQQRSRRMEAPDVTDAVQDDLANARSAARFRIQFRQEDGLGSARFTGLTDLDGIPTANLPVLWVRYRVK